MATRRAAIDARLEIAELNRAARFIPDNGFLVRAIALQEARLSSEIERIVTTDEEIYRALSQPEISQTRQTKEVLRYGDAVWFGYRHLHNDGPIDPEFLERLASTILERTVSIRDGSGTSVGDPRTGKVVYTPPAGRTLLTSLLKNMLDYWERTGGSDPLIEACFCHYQFEAIHSFVDANGRIGRILLGLQLVERGLLEKPILLPSRGILEDRKSYYSGLRRITEQGDWEPWLHFMLENIAATALETRRRIEGIQQELEQALTSARAEMRRGFSAELIRLIFSQPYTRISALETAGIARRQAASEYLQELERIGLLRSERRGREVYYLNDRLLRILSL